jgi:hypothetical protein
MKSKRFTDEQIIKILQEAETGLSVLRVVRRLSLVAGLSGCSRTQRAGV